MSKSKPKRPRWVDWCPVCARVGSVRGILPARVGEGRRVYNFACVACVLAHHLMPIRAITGADAACAGGEARARKGVDS